MRIGTLGVSIAVARLGGLHAAGAFGIALQATALGSMLATFNLPQSLARHLAQTNDPSRRRALLRTSGWLVLGLSIAVALLMAALAAPIAAHFYRDRSLAPIIAASAALTFATAGCLWLEGALQGVRRFDRLATWGGLLTVLDLVIGIAASFVGVVAVVLGRAVARLGAVAGALLRWGAGWSRAQRPADRAEPLVTAEGGTAAALLGFAGPALLSAIIVLAGQTVLRLLLVRGSGLDAAGHYQAADSLAQSLALLPGAASVAFMRAVASDHRARGEDFAGMLRRGLERITGWNLPLCLLLIGVVRWVPELVFGRAFAPTRPVLVVLAVAGGLMGPASIYGAAMLGRGEVWTGVAVNALWAVVVLGAFALGTSSLGAPGAAIAVTIGYLVLVAACVGVIAPRWSVPLSALLPSTLATLAVLALAAASVLAPHVPEAVSTLVCGVLALVIFLVWGKPAWSDLSSIGKLR